MIFGFLDRLCNITAIKKSIFLPHLLNEILTLCICCQFLHKKRPKRSPEKDILHMHFYIYVLNLLIH